MSSHGVHQVGVEGRLTILLGQCAPYKAERWSTRIAGASNVGPITAGPWAGRRCTGCSVLMNPNGEAVITGPYGADAEAILHHRV